MVGQESADRQSSTKTDVGLVVATDGGAMWFVDWDRDVVEEVFSCHAGAPRASLSIHSFIYTTPFIIYSYLLFIHLLFIYLFIYLFI